MTERCSEHIEGTDAQLGLIQPTELTAIVDPFLPTPPVKITLK